MFGLPAHHIFSQTVGQLTHAHKRTKDGLTGVEPALLHMLEQAIASDSGKGTAAGVSRTGAPLDVGALHLRDTIAAVVAEHWPGHGVVDRQGTPLIARLVEWATEVAGTANEQHLQELCSWWVRDIRQHLEPQRPIPLRGTACLQCKAVTIPTQDEDGGTVLQPALQAHVHTAPVQVECIACGTNWSGGGVYQYQKMF